MQEASGRIPNQLDVMAKIKIDTGNPGESVEVGGGISKRQEGILPAFMIKANFQDTYLFPDALELNSVGVTVLKEQVDLNAKMTLERTFLGSTGNTVINATVGYNFDPSAGNPGPTASISTMLPGGGSIGVGVQSFDFRPDYNGLGDYTQGYNMLDSEPAIFPAVFFRVDF